MTLLHNLRQDTSLSHMGICCDQTKYYLKAIKRHHNCHSMGCTMTCPAMKIGMSTHHLSKQVLKVQPLCGTLTISWLSAPAGTALSSAGDLSCPDWSCNQLIVETSWPAALARLPGHRRSEASCWGRGWRASPLGTSNSAVGLRSPALWQCGQNCHAWGLKSLTLEEAFSPATCSWLLAQSHCTRTFKNPVCSLALQAGFWHSQNLGSPWSGIVSLNWGLCVPGTSKNNIYNYTHGF